MAAEYGLSQQALCDIVMGRTWKHLPVLGSAPRMPPVCIVEGCSEKSRTKSMCAVHYMRTKNGSPMWERKRIDREPIAVRFWRFAKKAVGCWLWTGARNRKGYGTLAIDRMSVGAHRVSWEIHVGVIPSGLQVLHRCDNPPCTNPDHLFLGTIQDNIADMMSKGRQVRGERQARAVLTAQIVRDICLRHSGGQSVSTIANAIGFSYGAIKAVVSGQTWKHVYHPDPLP